MTTTIERPELITPEEPGGPDGHGPDAQHGDADARHEGPTGILKWLTSTDHKVIGMSYMITSLVMFFLAGIMALVIRAQLADPTLVAGLLPDLQRAVHHARQPHAVPVRRAVRLRRPGQLHRAAPGRGARHGVPPAERPVVLAVPERHRSPCCSGFLVAGGAASFGWVAYAPLSNATNSPGAGGDLWLMAWP